MMEDGAFDGLLMDMEQ